jgi:hypothetical protein
MQSSFVDEIKTPELAAEELNASERCAALVEIQM